MSTYWGTSNGNKLSIQDWGTFNGNKFTGNLLLPERYTEAVVLGMLSKIFPDLRNDYEFELKTLKGGKQDLTQISLEYNLGGIKPSHYQDMEGITDIPEQPITPSKIIYFEIASAETTATPEVSGYTGTITVTRDGDGNILIKSTTADFNNYTYIDPNNNNCNFALVNNGEIIIYPPESTDLAVTIWNT